jgi:drug/metabolite transporter (DMT)-like permease
LWNQGFEHLPARVGGLYLLVQPLVGGALGWLWLGESLGLGFGVGALLIVSAAIVASRVSASPPALANRGSG